MENNLSKLVKNKKAQIRKKINSVLIVILTIVILFSVFEALVPEAQSAGDELGDAQRCSDAGGFYNTTQPNCLTNSSATGTVIGFSAIPISSIFGSSGVVILLLMVALLIIVLKSVLPKKK